MAVFIGTSGFSYSHWEGGVFYPEDLPKSKELEYYCKHFDTVELNVTFYRLPSKEAFKSWNRRSPKNFHFVLKGSRFITHIKRLKDAADPLRIFFDQARPLIKKTDVILWQLPPRFKIDLDRLESFMKLLRRRKNTRHAFEFRDKSWIASKVFDAIRDYGMTVCRADWRDVAVPDDEEFPFEYARRHGPLVEVPYDGCYTDKLLKADAKLIKGWKKKRKDIYVYFNNDAYGYAVKNALTLKKFVKSKVKS